MTWPAPDQYAKALQTPGFSFCDGRLKAGAVTLDRLGFPKSITGNFASVYELKTASGRVAVRCFLRGLPEHRDRYQRLGEWLKLHPVSSYVPFNYQERGILVNGTWYPILEMAWAEGRPLDSFVCASLKNTPSMLHLADVWRRVVRGLASAGVAHGDLQHGNILVTDGLDIRLVDYDGVFIPPLKGQRAIELGHPNYQHPRRSGDARFYDHTLDNFPALVIYLSLRALAVQPALWRFNSGENLILTRSDFEEPSHSDALAELRGTRFPELRTLTEQLVRSCQESPSSVPPLESLLSSQSRPGYPPRPLRPSPATVSAPMLSPRPSLPPTSAAQVQNRASGQPYVRAPSGSAMPQPHPNPPQPKRWIQPTQSPASTSWTVRSVGQQSQGGGNPKTSCTSSQQPQRLGAQPPPKRDSWRESPLVWAMLGAAIGVVTLILLVLLR